MTHPLFSQTFHTRLGHRVVLDGVTPHNALGDVVSYPLKGTIFYKDRPRKRARMIWNLQGRTSLFGEKPHDLVDFPPLLRLPAPPCLDCAA